MTQDKRSQVIRCLCSVLYEDAGLDEIADACETSTYVVKAVLDDMRLRRCLVHAKMVSEQLDLGLDDSPEAVITMALEHFYSSAPTDEKQRREMRWVMAQMKS